MRALWVQGCREAGRCGFGFGKFKFLGGKRLWVCEFRGLQIGLRS